MVKNEKYVLFEDGGDEGWLKLMKTEVKQKIM